MDIAQKKAILTGLGVVIFGILFAILIAFLADLKLKKSGFRIKIAFTYLNNLNKGAPVLAAGGIPVGFVEDIYQKDLQTYVQLYLYDSLKNKLPKRKETIFSVFTNNLMGEKYINLTIPESLPNDTFLDEGDIWYGVDPPSMEKMMLSFSSWFREGEASQVIDDIIQQTAQLKANTRQIFQENEEDVLYLLEQGKISRDSISGKLKQLMENLNQITSDFQEISEKSRADFVFFVRNLSDILKGLSGIQKIFLAGQGSFGKLVKGSELQKNTSEAIKNAKEFLRCIREKPWVLIYKEPC